MYFVMKFLIFGSSLAYHLGVFDQVKTRVINGITVEFIYKSFSGKSYEHFLKNPHLIDEVLQCQPDLVLVILGTNSISTKVTKSVLLQRCGDFYRLFRQRLDLVNPEARVISHQLPLRFVYDHRHNTPKPPQYKLLRNYVNSYVNLMPEVDHMLVIGGRGRLDDKNLFRDGIHFKDIGLQIHYNIIIGKLRHIL